MCVALTLGVGYDAVDTPWPYVETSAGLPADGTWVGDKPGLET